jgi:hypothetical protein
LQKQISELFGYMDSTREKFLKTAASINPVFAGVRPRGNQWSAEQIVAHLAAVEDRVGRSIRKSIDTARAEGLGPETSDEPILSSLDQHGIADATVKRESPEAVVPQEGRPIGDSLTALAVSREELKEAFRSADGLALSMIIKNHGAIGEANMYQWGLFLAQHEERHRRQLEKTINEVTELAAESAPIV